MTATRPPPAGPQPTWGPAAFAAVAVLGVIFVGILVLAAVYGSPIVALGIGVFVAIGVTSAYIAWRNMKRRQAAFRSLAQERGWSYLDSDAADRPVRFVGFRPFGHGHSREALNVVAGAFQGMPFEAFTYRWKVTTGSGKNRRTHTYHAAVVAVPMPVQAPGLAISPEGLGHKLWDALGGEDIDTESDAFSRAFWVRCEDRRFAYDVLNPRMTEHLLAVGPVGTWEWRGGSLVRVLRNGWLEPPHLLPALAAVQGFIGNLPRHRMQQRAA